jgi:hypothetical protein
VIEGKLRSEGDRAGVRFERRYDFAPEEVWSALTDPDRLGRWLANVVELAVVVHPLHAVLADRLEHPIEGLGAGGGEQQAVIGEAGQRVRLRASRDDPHDPPSPVEDRIRQGHPPPSPERSRHRDVPFAHLEDGVVGQKGCRVPVVADP